MEGEKYFVNRRKAEQEPRLNQSHVSVCEKKTSPKAKIVVLETKHFHESIILPFLAHLLDFVWKKYLHTVKIPLHCVTLYLFVCLNLC